MTDSERERSSGRAKILKALAHPSRIFIVEKLNEKSYCVGELTEMIGADASTVSKHLAVLKNAGIISDEKKGTSVYYILDCPCVMEFIGCVESVIQQKYQKEFSWVLGKDKKKSRFVSMKGCGLKKSEECNV